MNKEKLMRNWESYQKININKETELCTICGSNLLDITNFKYKNKTKANPVYWEELCQCRNCDNLFIIHYDIFDSEGHIYSRIFSEDINNINYCWQDNLTKKQKMLISEHIINCKICCDRLSQTILADAWLKSFMETLKKK